MSRMVSSGPVRVDARARELGEQVMRPRVLPGPVMIPLNLVTTGLLTPALREQYGLAWGPNRRRAYRLAVAVVPKEVGLQPPLLRVWPRPGRSIGFTAGGRANTTF